MGITIRKAESKDSVGIAHVHVDTWRSAYEGIVPYERLANLSYERSQQMWEGILRDVKMSTFVAEDDSGRIAGFANCGSARDTKDFGGELYAIYVLQNAQRMGIGRRLVLAVANDLVARGFSSMLVWVLEENPSRRFYEGLRGTELESKDITIGGKTLKETGYGWKDLNSLITQLAGFPGRSP